MPEPVPPRMPSVEPAGTVSEMWESSSGQPSYAKLTSSKTMSRCMSGSHAPGRSCSGSESMM